METRYHRHDKSHGWIALGPRTKKPVETTHGLPEMFHWVAIRAVASPSRSPLRTPNHSKRGSGSRLVVWGGSSRKLFNSSAIGGFLMTGGCPVLGL